MTASEFVASRCSRRCFLTAGAALGMTVLAAGPCRAIGPVGTPVWGKAHSFRCGFSLTEGRSFAGLGQSVWFFFIRRAFSKGEAGKNSWAAFWRKGLAGRALPPYSIS